MNKISILILGITFLFIIACDKNKLEPRLQPSERIVRTVYTNDIPEVMSFINNTLGLDDVTRSSANLNEVSNFTGALKLEKALEIIDTLKNSNYTFLVNDEDNDPFTFTNLVIKRNSGGQFYTPFVLEYEVDSANREEFLLNNFSMAHFTGMVVRRYLKSDDNSYSDYVANLEHSERNISFDENCDEVTYYSGGGPSDGPTTGDNTGTTSGDSGTSSWSANCVQYYEDLLIDKVCPKYIGEGSQCVYYYISVLVTNCGEPPSHTEVNDPNDCPSPGSEEVGVIIEDEEFRMLALKYFLEINPHALIDATCDQIEEWISLSTFQPRQSVIDKMKQLDQNYSNWKQVFTGGFSIQEIQEAKGVSVNLDYFSVTVTELPNNMSANQLLTRIRTGLNGFVDNDLAIFTPFPYKGVSTGYNESLLWSSNNPINSLLHIEIGNGSLIEDHGSVICSDFNTNNWKFTTIEAPFDWNHPVSGTREFGYTSNPDGSYTFYTRGVDRISYDMFKDVTLAGGGIGDLANYIAQGFGFGKADELWESLQNNIEIFVNNNGGYAFKNIPVKYRPRWDDLKDVLEGKKPIETLDCN